MESLLILQRSSEKTQITLIVLWLLEIYQNKLGALRDQVPIIIEISILFC